MLIFFLSAGQIKEVFLVQLRLQLSAALGSKTLTSHSCLFQMC